MIPFDLPPKPALWTPPRPAIIRAASMKDIAPNLSMPMIGTFAAASIRGLRGAAAVPYRYLRFTETSNVGGLNPTTLYEIDYSADGGSTWVPSSAMTTNSAPSPLVAVADSEFNASFLAFYAFDNDGTTTRWSATSTAHPHWITIDLGAGNEIAPNRFRWTNYNTGGNDYTPKDYTIKASNTGSFAGEEVTLLTVTGGTTAAHQATVTKTI